LGKLSAIDLAILLATLLAAVGAGLLLGKRAATSRAWLVGERDLPWWAVLLSIVATETSAVTFLSVPGKSFDGDLTFLQIPLGYVVGRLLVARLLLPLYFQGEALTSYEVLGRRFGPGVRRASSLLFLVTRNLADGLRLYLTALPLELLTGLPLWASVAAMGALTVAYTFVGGMRAVVWTDVVQFFVYVGGGLLALEIAAGGVDGGLVGVLSVARESGKLRLFDFAPVFDRENVFAAGLVGGAFLTLATHGADQLMVQRYLCARGRREAGLALVLSGVVVLLQFALFLLIGLALFACFRERAPDALDVRGDRAFPVFIAERLSRVRGAAGFVLGAVFAVSMSTLSSSLNSSAAAAVNDWLRPAVGRRWDDARALRVTRGAMVGFALVQTGCALAGPALEESVVSAVLAIASFTTGLTLGLFLLARVLPEPVGGVERRRQGASALAAFGAMLAAMILVFSGTSLAWPWYSVVGSLGTLLVGMGLARAPLRG
jgi:SSS family transporter